MSNIIKRILTSLFFLAIMSAKAQGRLGAYDHLFSAGEFPVKMIKTLQSEINARIDQKNSGRISYKQKLSLDTLIWNDIFLYNLLLSGEVLYGDSIGMYINKVAGELLKQDPGQLDSVHFYIIRSSSPEIHTFSNGFVFISTGFVAQLESEAQLAFILAQQMSHCKKKHRFIIERRENIEITNRNKFFYLQLLADLKKPFSDKEEQEADQGALEIMQNSGYNLKGVDQAFDFLYYSYLPFDDIPFERTFFNDAGLKLRDTLFLKNTSPISTSDDKLQHSSLQVSVQKRRERMKEMRGNIKGGFSFYILPKKDFICARQLARFSICTDYLTDRDYVNAIYASHLLLKKYPGDFYLQSVVSKALYALNILRSPSRRGSRLVYEGMPEEYVKEYDHYSDLDHTTRQGSSQSLYYLFEKIDPLELNVLSVLYTWKIYKSTGSPSSKFITDSLLSELFLCNGMSGSNFSRISAQEARSLDSLAVLDGEGSKYEKIKSQQARSTDFSIEKNLAYAFVELFKEEEFLEMFKRTLLRSRSRTKEEKTTIDLSVNKANVQKVIIVDPAFTIFPFKLMNYELDIKKSAKQREIYNNRLITELKKKGMDYQLLPLTDSLHFSCDEYNDRSWIHTWLVEREKNGSNPETIVLGSQDPQAVAERFGTPYLLFCGIRSFDQLNDRTDHFFKVYNIVSGELVQFSVSFVNYMAGADAFNFAIATCVKELSKNAGSEQPGK